MWEKLKNLLKTTNEKAIIIEEGEPRYVILSIDEYTRLNTQNQGVEFQTPQDSITQSTYGQPSTAQVQPPQPLDFSSVGADLTYADEEEMPSVDLADDSGSEITLEDLPL